MIARRDRVHKEVDVKPIQPKKRSGMREKILRQCSAPKEAWGTGENPIKRTFSGCLTWCGDTDMQEEPLIYQTGKASGYVSLRDVVWALHNRPRKNPGRIRMTCENEDNPWCIQIKHMKRVPKPWYHYRDAMGFTEEENETQQSHRATADLGRVR